MTVKVHARIMVACPVLKSGMASYGECRKCPSYDKDYTDEHGFCHQKGEEVW